MSARRIRLLSIALSMVLFSSTANSQENTGGEEAMRRRQGSSRDRPNVPGISISESISPVQKIKVTAEDGNTLEIAVRTPPGDGPFPAIIFLHGGMKESSIGRRIRESKSGALPTRFLAAGYVIVIPTYRTYEENSRDPGPIDDCVAVVDCVKKMPDVEAQSVVVFGASGGGRLALELSGLGERTGLAAVVCGEPATTLFAEMYPVGMKGPNMEVSRTYQKYYGEENSAILDRKVKKLSCPILIVHSDVHQINTLNNRFLIPKIKAQGKDLKAVLYPGVRHGFYWGQGRTGITVEMFEEMAADIKGYLREHLMAKPVALSLDGISSVKQGPDPARVEAIARMLPEFPKGLGRPITDREAWSVVAGSAGVERIIAQAESVMSELNTQSTGGGRSVRRDRLSSRPLFTVAPLVLAECIEDSGRFLSLIEKTIQDYAAFPTWVGGRNLSRWSKVDGVIVGIDLSASQSAWNLATIYYWLGDRLSEETRELIRNELERRIFIPFEGSVLEDFPNCWWLKGRNKNNWNPVCLGSVSGVALAVIESRQRRAFFVASAENYVRAYLGGYQEDGFCTEGLGYWVYGFGHFVDLAESLYQATGEKLDLLESPKVKTIARFGARMEILPGVYPAYADCRINQQPEEALTAFLYRRYGWGKPSPPPSRPSRRRSPSLREMDFSLMRLYEWAIHNFPNSATARPVLGKPAPPSPLRDWFAETGAYVGRPTHERRDRALGVAFKGGHNGEHHNHNDVGTYVVALRGKTPLLDPGREEYTGRTFSTQRYESNVLNSYGHPVPRVAGKLQSKGRSAAVRVVETVFTDEMDSVVLDLSEAYDVEEIQELKRTFVYSRQGEGSLVVIDEVVFSTPQYFETAMITLSDWRQVGEKDLVVGEGSEAVQVQISSAGGDFRIQAEKLQDGANPIRLGITLTEPVARGTIKVRIVPASSDE